MEQEALQALAEMVEAQNRTFADMFEAQNHMLGQMIRDSETRINVKIENEVSKKIEALFDGYKLTHDKQWELERRVNEMERRLEEISALIQAG